MKLVLPVVAVALLGLVGQALARPSSDSSSSTSAACAPGYRPCLPVRADLDCKDIPDAKTPVRVTGSDPYGLDADRDGLGCERGGGAGGALSPFGLIIRYPIRKEAELVRFGVVVWAVGWSPKRFTGKRFELCGGKAVGRCVKGARPLRGKLQVFGRWTVAGRDLSGGLFWLRLRVQGRTRAVDFAPVGR
jgi:hypothetical protein